MAAMAVKDPSLYHATEDLILAGGRRYYQDNIDTGHWQLRNLISSPEQNIIYYPHGREIIALNTKTKEREVVSKLLFNPRCVTASFDCICAGGDAADFTVIPLGGGDDESEPDSSSSQDADSRLPMELDPVRRSDSRDSRLNARRSPTRRISPNTSKVGREIVNCISIWYPGEDRSERSYKTAVAVVSNNDCSVSILDLETSDLLESLTLPDCVNRSVISPDGSLLATICDDPYLYIHERRVKAKSSLSGTKSYEWTLAGRIYLEGQRQRDKTHFRGSFAACFSGSGKYLAVATQYGILHVFETKNLTDADSNVSPIIFTSSRPEVIVSRPTEFIPGGIRAIEFSPGPYDLLAWTESDGRFCVADVRNSFLSRQLIMLDPLAEGMERVVILDKQIGRNPKIDRRHPESLFMDAERRQIRQLTRIIMDGRLDPLLDARLDPQPFSAEETEVLNASRAARRQRDRTAAQEASSREPSVSRGTDSTETLLARQSAIDTSSRTNGRFIVAEGLSSVLRDRAAAQEATSTEPSTSRWSDSLENRLARQSGIDASSRADNRNYPPSLAGGLPSALRDFMNPDRNASFRSFINERNRENERRNQRQLEPRRRSSMLLAAAENALERETRTANEIASSSLERLTLTPPRIGGSDSPNNPWVEIDALYRSRFPLDAALDRSTRLRVQLEDEDRRDFAHRLRQPWQANPTASEYLTSIGSGRRSEVASETMGLCWSPDGRILYVGAGNGIYEYHVNILARKQFPSLVLR